MPVLHLSAVTRRWPGVVLALLLAACAGEQKPGVDGPGKVLKPSDVKDARPHPVNQSSYVNRPSYQVLGKSYYVMDSSVGYREKGYASWYGAKFHGRRTSTGEVYDMYKATAAHKTLPLPTFAEVTNLENGRKVIVKINDRGPFHSDRMIDLSYAAAVKLGMADQGTGRVEVRAITFEDDNPPRMVKVLEGPTFLQAGAFASKSSAKNLARVLEENDIDDVDVDREGGYYKVLIGPFKKAAEINSVASRIVELGYERPHRVRR